MRSLVRASAVTPTGVERTFPAEDIIVSKTDPKGFLTYVNDVFVDVSRYSEAELIGKPHSIIRHPDMPRSVFRLMWQTIESGQEMFAYVVNLAHDGAHYWVLAHVTPSFDRTGRIVGYHSNRRSPDPAAVKEAADVYALLRAEEARHTSPVQAMDAATALLGEVLASRGQTYDEWVWDVTGRSAAVAR